MANQLLLPIGGTAAYGSATAATTQTNMYIDADTIARIEPLSATTTAIHFNQTPATAAQKVVLTHTDCGTAPTTNPFTGLYQYPVKDGILAALTGMPSTPTVAVQVPNYVTGTTASPVYTRVVITAGLWS
jgi:hypothetical protein